TPVHSGWLGSPPSNCTHTPLPTAGGSDTVPSDAAAAAQTASVPSTSGTCTWTRLDCEGSTLSMTVARKTPTYLAPVDPVAPSRCHTGRSVSPPSNWTSTSSPTAGKVPPELADKGFAQAD